ncbi:hypothetical protein [Pacificitalea manganoxidans]|nr:hypothetical protein [Pacificitalea manganoxidans]MDR6309467.1 hypothetical protein [Pacificitalea manganoxidans]
MSRAVSIITVPRKTPQRPTASGAVLRGADAPAALTSLAASMVTALPRFRISHAAQTMEIVDTAPMRHDPAPRVLRRACVLGMVATGALALRLSSPGLAMEASALALGAALLALWLIHLGGEPRRALRLDRAAGQIVVHHTPGGRRGRIGAVMARIETAQIRRMGIGPCPHRPALARLWIDFGRDRITLLTGRAVDLRPVAEALDTELSHR